MPQRARSRVGTVGVFTAKIHGLRKSSSLPQFPPADKTISLSHPLTKPSVLLLSSQRQPTHSCFSSRKLWHSGRRKGLFWYQDLKTIWTYSSTLYRKTRHRRRSTITYDRRCQAEDYRCIAVSTSEKQPRGKRLVRHVIHTLNDTVEMLVVDRVLETMEITKQ